jgi:hypothetical protein
MSAKWKMKAGVSIQKGPDDEWDFENGREQLILTYCGRYELLLANRPIHGAYVAGYGTLLRVIRVKVKKSRGEKGTMTVTLERDSQGYTIESDFDTPTLEVEWARTEKAQESHPKFKDIYDADKEKVAEYFGKSDASSRRTIYLALKTVAGAATGGPVTNAATSAACALLLIDVKNKGADSYVVYSPVVRRTTKKSVAPLTGTCATEVLSAEDLEDVVGEPVPAGYEYIKTADRGTRSGSASRWQRIEEWTGATDVDDVIYPVGVWT